MRVIAGTAKGRRLDAPRGRVVRPTADRVKEALFSILGSRFDLDGAVLLDLFAGSGALGIEALSRGAAMVTFVEQDAAARRALGTNLDRCGLAQRGRMRAQAAGSALTHLAAEGAVFDGVLMDPPYGQSLADRMLTTLGESALLRPDGWVMAEHHCDDRLAAAYAGLRLTTTKRYGKTVLSLYRKTDEPDRRGENVNRKAVYAGSFDPITKGHLDIVRRALGVFDRIVVAVAHNPAKESGLFTATERVAMIREALTDVADNIEVDAFNGLLVDYCDRVGAHAIIRGLRAVSDFEYEFQMAMMNRHLNNRVETYFMTASEAYFYTASRLVKEVASLGGNVSGLVPAGVNSALVEKLAGKRS